MSVEERDEDTRNDLITAEEAVEVVEEEIESSEDEVVESEAPEGDPEVVERAKKYGHLSKEEWIAQGRNPDEWKSAEEFDKTGKVIEQLYSLKKKVDQRDREIQALVDYQQRTSQREYERAKQDLEARLNSSKNDMDIEGVSHYTKELTRLEDMEKQNQVQQSQQVQANAKQAFIERNQHWFNDRNPDLQQRAFEIDNEIQQDINNGRLKVNSYDDIATMIEKRLSYEHPERVLGSAKSTRPNVTSSSVNKTAVVKKDLFKNLSQEHKDTYTVYKRINPKITEADFIQRLKKDGEI